MDWRKPRFLSFSIPPKRLKKNGCIDEAATVHGLDGGWCQD